MVKRRTGGYKVIMTPLAQDRIKNNSCPACGLPKKEWKRRKDWNCCSVECTRNFWDKEVTSFSWETLRIRCFERDGYSCVKCGRKFESSGLIADHIHPIALGGDEWDIDNLQTLCRSCNKVKTAEDAGKIARLRRLEKMRAKGQTHF